MKFPGLCGPVLRKISRCHKFCNFWQITKKVIAYCGITLVRPGRRRSRRAFAGCLGGFRRLVAPSPMARPGLQSVILWTFLSQAHPSLRDAPRLPLLLSLLQRRFRTIAGAAILYLPSRPDVGGLPSPYLIRLSST